MSAMTFAYRAPPAPLPYRDPLEGARLRYADLVAGRVRDAGPRANAATVRGRRIARIAAGAVGLGGATLLAGAALAKGVDRGLFHDGNDALTRILLWTWPAIGLAYVAGRVDLWSRLAAVVPERPARDVHAAIARLEDEIPVETARDDAARLEKASIGLPLMAWALLGPLTLHCFVTGFGALTRDFDTWILLSLAIVGHAHLVLAALSWRYAGKIARNGDTNNVASTWVGQAGRAWGWTILTAAIPGALLILIPPVLTAITGLFAVFPAFYLAAERVVSDRRLLRPLRA